MRRSTANSSPRMANAPGPDRGREVAEIEQVEVAASRAGADEPAGFKEVVVAEAALQRTVNENMDHCASVPVRPGGYIAL